MSESLPVLVVCLLMSSSAVVASGAFYFAYQKNKVKIVNTNTSGGGGGSGGGGPNDLKKVAMTYYNFEDNTPCNSTSTSSQRSLIPYVSVAVPFRFLKEFGGTYNYGDQLHVKFLEGRKMPNGATHTGWVQIDDICGDNNDDTYCYQEGLPNVDLYVGAWKSSGMKCNNGTADGPGGGGQEMTEVVRGPAPAGKFIKSYGGVAKGSGKCDDCVSACMAVTGLSAAECKPPAGGNVGSNSKLQKHCWHYWPQNNAESKSWCK